MKSHTDIDKLIAINGDLVPISYIGMARLRFITYLVDSICGDNMILPVIYNKMEYHLKKTINCPIDSGLSVYYGKELLFGIVSAE